MFYNNKEETVKFSHLQLTNTIMFMSIHNQMKLNIMPVTESISYCHKILIPSNFLLYTGFALRLSKLKTKREFNFSLY